MKNNIEKIAFYAFASICAFFISDCATAQKAKTVLCDKQTESQFLSFHAANVGLLYPETSQLQFKKPNKKHVPVLGDVVILEDITGFIITEPTRKTNGYEFKIVAQGNNCTTKVYKVGEKTRIQKFARLQKF